jgi:hypothetical protein
MHMHCLNKYYIKLLWLHVRTVSHNWSLGQLIALWTILCADFFQFRPVQPSTTLYSAVVDAAMPVQKHHRGERVTRKRISYKADSYGRMGTELFAQYTMVALTAQERASAVGPLNDKHRRLLQRLRDTTLDSPIDRESLQYLGSREITAAMVMSRPELARAPIMYACNAERLAMQTAKAQRFCKEMGIPLLMYKVSLYRTQDVELSKEEIDELFAQGNALWIPFVPNRGAFLTAPISRERGLCNGCPVVTHSLTFKACSEAMLQDIRDMIDAAAPGEIVRLPLIPDAVNVTIPDATPEMWGDGATLVSGTVVVPVRQCKVEHTQEVLVRGRYVAIRYTTIGVELDFCISLYKAQSRTLPLAIMDANKRPGTEVLFESLVVGASRVTDANDYYLMPVLPGKTLYHMLDLRVCSQLRTYMSGFVDGRGKFDSVRAQAARDVYESKFPAGGRTAHHAKGGAKLTQLQLAVRASIAGTTARGGSVSATLARAATASSVQRQRVQAAVPVQAVRAVPEDLCLLSNFGASCFINVIFWVSGCAVSVYVGRML